MYDYEEFPDGTMEPVFTKGRKMLSRPDGFMLYGVLGVQVFFTFQLLLPNMNIRHRLIRPRTSFYNISDNPNLNLGIVGCSLYTRRITLKDDYHKKRMDMLAYTTVKYKQLETLTKTFIIPALQHQFIQENFFKKASVRRIAKARNKNFAFKGSHTKNPFFHHAFGLRRIRILRGSQ